jgi:uncharacterized membrane protein
MIQKFLLKMKKSVWIFPAFYSVGSFLFALVVVWFDTSLSFEITKYVPTVFLTSVDLAITILTVIAGSLITMTTFTFSTTMIVLTTYSSQFSPRTVENFLSDDKTMKALGVFMGGFVFSMITLFFMRLTLNNQLVISASISILFAIYCLYHFTMYIQHVGSYIQTNNLINRLFDSAVSKIESYRRLVSSGKFSEKLELDEFPFAKQVMSPTNGYIQLINHERLSRIANKEELVLLVKQTIGQFVSEKTLLVSIYQKEKNEIEQELIAHILDCFTLSYEKTEFQDFNFSIQKMVEIGLRAISPSTNDPNTTNHCLKIIGVLMGMLSDLDDGYFILDKNTDNPYQAIFEAYSFNEEMYYAIYQLAHYGSSDVSVVYNLLNMIQTAMEKATLTNKEILVDYLDYVWDKINPKLLEGMDGEYLKTKRKTVIALTV